MRRQCVVRDRQFQGDLSGCKTFGTVSNQEPEHLQATGLRKCSQGIDRMYFVHMSSIIEIMVRCKIKVSLIG